MADSYEQLVADREALMDERRRLLAEAVAEHRELILLRATVRKYRNEKKLLHEMLTEAGISEDVLHDGVRTCLIGRVAAAIALIE